MDQVTEVLRLSGTVGALSEATGLRVPGLRLLLGLLAGYPLAFVYRFILPRNTLLRHLYSTLSGVWLAFFCYGNDVVHSFLSILLTWLVLRVIPSRLLALQIVWVGNMAHLLGSYLMFATDNYDIDFTTSQCVLTLRLIGLAWDYYDGGRDEKDLEHDQKLNGLKELPSLLEVYSWCYFFVGFLIGPQFTLRLYRQFYTNQMFKTDKGESVPSNWWPVCRVLLLGAIYLAVSQVLGAFFDESYLLSAKYNASSLLEKMVYTWMVCKAAFSRYIGVWLIGEGSGVLVGIHFCGYNQDGTVKGWDALSNEIIEAFNVNTNDWVKRYVFKRLKSLGNRQISAIASLVFLAVWHGFYGGYYLCFFMEFVDMEAERAIRARLIPFNQWLETNPSAFKSLIKIIYYSFCWIVRTSALHYGIAPLIVKKWDKAIGLYSSFYWIGLWVVIAIIVVDKVLPKPRSKGKNE